MTIFWFWMLVIFLAAVLVLGQAFVDRRVAQNAADAAALSAAGEATYMLKRAPANPGCIHNRPPKPGHHCGARYTVYPLHGSPYCIDYYTPQQCVQFQSAYLLSNLGQLQGEAVRYATADYGVRVDRELTVQPDRSGLRVKIKVWVHKTMFPAAPRMLSLPGFRIPAVSKAYVNF